MPPFIAIDVETANRSRASICQIGLVACNAAQEIWRWTSLVDPEEGFEKEFVEDYHGIHPDQVADAPLFPQVLEVIAPSLTKQFVVSWWTFDQDAIAQASEKYGISAPDCTWIDACAVAREVWPDLPNHKLNTVATALGLEFEHHKAIEDAWACSRIFQEALKVSGTSIEYWPHRFGERRPAQYDGPVPLKYEMSCSYEGNTEGPLAGHVLLLTGDFVGGKARLANRAASLGCAVKRGWSKKITLLVVGTRDPAKFAGSLKSKKHELAEEAQRNGHEVAILAEGEFLDWLATVEQ